MAYSTCERHALQPAKKIGDGDFQGRGNSHEGVNGDIFLAALDVADIVVVEIRFFGQFFLAPPHVPAMRADVFA